MASRPDPTRSTSLQPGQNERLQRFSARVRRFFAPPVITAPRSFIPGVDKTSEELNRNARLLNTITWISIVLIVAALLLTGVIAAGWVIPTPAPDLIHTNLPLIFALLVIGLADQALVITLLKRGKLVPASQFQLLGGWGITAIAMLGTGGLHSPFAPMLLIFVVYGGLLLNQRYTFGLAAASLAIYTLSLGWPGKAQSPGLAGRVLTFYMWLGLTSTLALVTVIFNLVVRNLIASIEKAGLSQRQLSEANSQMEVARLTLEARVKERTLALERRARQLQASAEIAGAIVSIRELDALLDEITRLVSLRFGFYQVNLFLADPQEATLVLQAANTPAGRRLAEQGFQARVEASSIVGAAAALRKPYLAPDVSKDIMYLKLSELPDTRAEIAIPLLVVTGAAEMPPGKAASANQAGGLQRLIGVMDLQSKETAELQDEELSVLQTLANQVAIAIQNLRLVQENRQALEAAQRANAELSGQAWEKALRAQPGLGFLCSDEGEPAPVTGPWPEDMALAQASGQAVQAQPSRLSLPIKIRGQITGVLSLRKPAEAGEWLPEEVDLAETMNERLGAALESARLYEETRRRAERERLTGQITARMRASNDPAAILQTAALELRNALQASQARISVGNLSAASAPPDVNLPDETPASAEPAPENSQPASHPGGEA